ncbi:MAG: hypothetical protein K0041_08980 [Acidithiobacillus sp.]|nr:hypothetical protein [Acidithiobacillus sp.]
MGDKSRANVKEWSRIDSSLGRAAFGDLIVHIRSIYAKKKRKYFLVKEFHGHWTSIAPAECAGAPRVMGEVQMIMPN